MKNTAEIICDEMFVFDNTYEYKIGSWVAIPFPNKYGFLPHQIVTEKDLDLVVGNACEYKIIVQTTAKINDCDVPILEVDSEIYIWWLAELYCNSFRPTINKIIRENLKEGFIDGYKKKLKTVTDTNKKEIDSGDFFRYHAELISDRITFNYQNMLDAMNLGMSLRQDQLAGIRGKSGNELLADYISKIPLTQ